MKYHNVPVILDGIRFASKREANRYAELELMEKAGLITRLELQKRFDLIVNGVKVCTYVCDFAYKDRDGLDVIEDAKGVRTRDYRIKAKLMIACYGIRISEV